MTTETLTDIFIDLNMPPVTAAPAHVPP